MNNPNICIIIASGYRFQIATMFLVKTFEIFSMSLPKFHHNSKHFSTIEKNRWKRKM